MYINEWDIKEAGGRQWTVSMGSQSVKSNAEWVAGSLLPLLPSVDVGFKTLTITLLVYGNSRNEARRGVSEILGHLLEPVDLYLDGFDTVFRGTLKGHSVTEQKRIAGWSGWRRFLQLQLTFDGYEYGERTQVVATAAGDQETLLLVNPGTSRTPIRIHIECESRTQQVIKITGLASGEITIPREYRSDIFDLDGETGLITAIAPGDTQGVLSARAELWELPAIAPGETQMTVTGAGRHAIITVEYAPRYI